MIRLTYISSVDPAFRDEAEPILTASRRNNRRVGITGLLLFDGRRFLQALEGEPGPIEATYTRIKIDPRHRACVELGRTAIAGRAFAGWDMAWRRLAAAGEEATLAETVDRLVAQVPDASTRALFAGFARIERLAG